MARVERINRPTVFFVLSIAVAAQLASAARAQQAEHGSTADAYSLAAHKLDEFGRVGGCDHSARLDNFAIALMNDPNLTGYIIAYGPEGEGDGSGNFRLRVSADYLINQRGIDASRIKTIYGGRFREWRESASELWLAPTGADAPEPARYENEADTFTGMVTKYGAWDGLEYGEATGPPVGNASTAALKEMLRARPDTRAYVVVYHGEDSTLGLWRRVGMRDAEELQRGAGVKPDRVQVIFAGYRQEAEVQLWILPADAPPPAETAEETRRPDKAVQIGAFHSYVLKYPEDARYVFKGFADVLREEEHLRAFVIVRPDFGATGQTAEDTPAPPDEPPDVDLVQLAEKWKKDLAEEYGIGEGRLVVIIAPAREEWEAGQVETWLVPPGAAPPDPYAEAEAEETDEAEGTEGENEEPADDDPAPWTANRTKEANVKWKRSPPRS